MQDFYIKTIRKHSDELYKLAAKAASEEEGKMAAWHAHEIAKYLNALYVNSTKASSKND